MSARRLLLPLLATLLFSGCFRIEETITLQSDGSGKVHMVVSFPQLGMRYLPGKPTADWVRNLPDGVRVTSFKNEQGQTTIKGNDGKNHPLATEIFECDLSFEKVASLSDIRVRPDTRNAMAAEAGGTPGKMSSNKMSSSKSEGPDIGPFQKLELTEDGDLLKFRRVVQAAREPDDVGAEMMMAPGSAGRPKTFDLVDSILKISIICPGDVVEHNAHRIKGRTLTWEFNLNELQEHQDRDWIVGFTCRRDGGK